MLRLWCFCAHARLLEYKNKQRGCIQYHAVSFIFSWRVLCLVQIFTFCFVYIQNMFPVKCPCSAIKQKVCGFQQTFIYFLRGLLQILIEPLLNFWQYTERRYSNKMKNILVNYCCTRQSRCTSVLNIKLFFILDVFVKIGIV